MSNTSTHHTTARHIRTIDFLKWRFVSAGLSLALVLTFIGASVYRYQVSHGQQIFNFSVDFTGGIQASFKFSQPIAGEKIVSILEEKGWQGAVARQLSTQDYLVRVKNEAPDVKSEADNIRGALLAALPGYTIEMDQIDSVGPATGANLWSRSLLAMVVSLILMLIYIAARFFSVSYAMGAIISLAHDVLAILVVFLLFDKEISMNVIGAILAVLGYSINDTIVIFARIRENVQRLSGSSIYEIINLSITETLSRTILTTFATLLVVVSLFFFGGETLRDLSLALLIGIVFGIYSTIFIATPVLYWFYNDTRHHKAK